MSISLALFVVVYLAVFGIGFVYVLHLVHKGPLTDEGREPTSGGAGRPRTPARPLSAPEEGLDAGEPNARS
jgi:cytochrome d ubiquinol oxidase subunit I